MKKPPMPSIVCLCGSTRFWPYFHEAGWSFARAGEIVLSFSVCRHGTDVRRCPSSNMSEDVLRRLDDLHLRKIDLADRVFFLNVDGYISDSTCRELAYALGTGKRVAFLESERGEAFIKANTARLDGLIKELGVEEW